MCMPMEDIVQFDPLRNVEFILPENVHFGLTNGCHVTVGIER